MPVLVVGGHGQLGRALRRVAPGWTYASRDDLDLRGPVDLSPWRPSVVVNAAAYTAVDRAESEPELAFEVNAHGAGRLARACAEVGAPLIHVSTDYVFDGLKGAPYEVDDPVCPLSVYGRSKEAGEDEVRAALAQHVILRTAWLFGPDRPGFVSWVVDQGRRGVDVPHPCQDELALPCHVLHLLPHALLLRFQPLVARSEVRDRVLAEIGATMGSVDDPGPGG